MKIIFCWSDISGYMASCWRNLAQKPDLEVFVIAFQAKTATAFTDDLMADVSCCLLSLAERHDSALIQSLVLDYQPDIVALSGWLHPPYRQLTTLPQLRSVPLIMTMDTPWQGTLKQRLAPYALRSFLKRIDRVVVAGERSWQYAVRLGVTPQTIVRGLYGVDSHSLDPLWADRQPTWPQCFLFLGRYAPAKGLDILIDAYQQYRQQSPHTWPLICCGQGPLASLLVNQPGITDCGFVQPTIIADYLRQAGVLVLPSRFDPWPLALVEAAAAGLPVICTDACGSAVEVIRSGYNGWVVPTEDRASLCQALLAIDQRYDQLPIWGQRGQQLAAPYSAQAWGDRWQQLCRNLTHP